MAVEDAFSWLEGPGRLADDPRTIAGGRANSTLQYLFESVKLVSLRVFVSEAWGGSREDVPRVLLTGVGFHDCVSDAALVYCGSRNTDTHWDRGGDPQRFHITAAWKNMVLIAGKGPIKKRTSGSC